MKTTSLSPQKDAGVSVAKLLSYGVIFNGLFFVAVTLLGELPVRELRDSTQLGRSSLTLLAGLTFLYLGVLLRRRKRTAWLVSMIIYGVWALVLGLNTTVLLHRQDYDRLAFLVLVLKALVPAIIASGLIVYRKAFRVKSDIQNFAIALRFSLLVLLVAFAYGVIGYDLMDEHDFHQDLSFGEAVHHTIDQFGLTTAHPLVSYTHRAVLFQRSLTVVSAGALLYAFVSLFQPLRARFGDQAANRAHAQLLLSRYPASSEDFFKLWPHDKVYFFDDSVQAGFAYAVHRGVALVVGDPFGNPEKFGSLLRRFDEFCETNDWQVAFVHTEPAHNDWYKEHGFSLQKIGEEAVLDLEQFAANGVRTNKYFRHIRNKFEKQGYTVELLKPPYTATTIARLRHVSREWLELPGREERRFMMGYFTADYLRECPGLMVLRDKDGAIQAFMNQIPSYDKQEANFDLLRHTRQAPGNSNDYLLLGFIDCAREQGFARLNLGLCPLSGLGSHDEAHALIDNTLSFVYSNGDRFYSFSGLHRFKAKYEPVWSPRYIAYRDGVRGFTRAVTALTRAMKV